MRLVEIVKTINTSDPTYDWIPLGLWTWVNTFWLTLFLFTIPLTLWFSIAEIASGIIIGCLPVTPKFFHHYSLVFKNKVSSYVQTGEHGGMPKLSDSLRVRGFKKPKRDQWDTSLLAPSFTELEEQNVIVSSQDQRKWQAYGFGVETSQIFAYCGRNVFQKEASAFRFILIFTLLGSRIAPAN